MTVGILPGCTANNKDWKATVRDSVSEATELFTWSERSEIYLDGIPKAGAGVFII